MRRPLKTAQLPVTNQRSLAPEHARREGVYECTENKQKRGRKTKPTLAKHTVDRREFPLNSDALTQAAFRWPRTKDRGTYRQTDAAEGGDGK